MKNSLNSYSPINSNISNNNKDIIKLNSAIHPYYHDYNNKLNYVLKQLLGLNEHTYNIYNNKMTKIYAFKENILVHNKNISLIENNKTPYETITKSNLNNKKRKKYKISNFNTNNYFRPKSAVEQYNNINTSTKNSLTKSKILLDDNYFDISFIKNSDKNKNLYKSYSIKKNKNKINKKKNVGTNTATANNINVLKNSDIKAEIKNKIMNLKLKNNKPQMFIKRPIPTLNEKYLFYLPKDLKKDTKNKYNFFSYILTDDLYHNRNRIKKNKNKINIKKSINNILFNNYLLKTKIEKNNINDNNINNKNKIYKPVQLKIKEIINKNKNNKTPKIKSFKTFYYNLNINDEENTDFCHLIKSHPFKINNKSNK